MSKKIKFRGNFWEYFIMSLGLLLLSVITFGIALPYYTYWNFKYFFTKLRIENDDVIYIGNFWEYFIMSLGLLILSVLTFGLAFPYWIYWSVKYFFSHLELNHATNGRSSIIENQNNNLSVSPQTDTKLHDLKTKLKPNEIIVKFKSTKEYKILKKEQYLMDKELHINNDYIVIDENNL